MKITTRFGLFSISMLLSSCSVVSVVVPPTPKISESNESVVAQRSTSCHSQVKPPDPISLPVIPIRRIADLSGKGTHTQINEIMVGSIEEHRSLLKRREMEWRQYIKDLDSACGAK
jgi:hypothetical protein